MRAQWDRGSVCERSGTEGPCVRAQWDRRSVCESAVGGPAPVLLIQLQGHFCMVSLISEYLVIYSGS